MSCDRMLFKHHCPQAFELRLAQEELPGGFNTHNLFYHSVSWLGKDQYGAARLLREVADAWVGQRLVHCGQKFSKDEPSLSPAEISTIPGASSSMAGLDSVAFTVLERKGSKMHIKSDEDTYWSSQLGPLAEEYAKLKKHHQSLLDNECSKLAGGEAPPSTSAPSSAADAVPVENGEESSSNSNFETVDSLDALKQKYGISHQVQSECSGVEILVAKDNSLWLYAASENKLVPKNSQLGGYGTGQYVPTANEEKGVEFNITSDAEIIQLDMATFRTDGTGISTLTMYKMLLMAEQEKNATTLAVSWLKVARKPDLEAGQDGFLISVRTAMKFCRVKAGDDANKVTCKNVFAQHMEAVSASTAVGKCFRFRYERVGGAFKVQRPYVIARVGIQLHKGVPLKISS